MGLRGHPERQALLVSDGAYTIVKAVKDQYVTLKANPNYTWGPLPKVSQITIRFIQDPTAQVQALQNGEVSVISGQATADTVAALKSVKDVNVYDDRHRLVRARRPDLQQQGTVRPGDLRWRRRQGSRRSSGVPAHDPASGHRRQADQADRRERQARTTR